MPVLVLVEVLVEPIELVEVVGLAKAGALVLVEVLAPAIACEVVVVVRVLVSARFEAELLATDELLDAAAAVEANIPFWKELVLILLSTFGLVTEPGSSIPIINTRSRASATPTIIVERARRPSTK